MKWEFDSKAVQQADNEPTGTQIGSKAVLVSFGPPTKDTESKFVVCGFIQNLSMSQQKQVRELFEVGSGRKFMVDGPTRNNLNISRALFSGPSLLKVAGSGMMNRGINAESDNLIGTPEADKIFGNNQLNAVAADYNDSMWINLNSSVFQNPLGVLLQYKAFNGDGSSTDYGSVFLQNCKIRSHNMSLQAGQWLTNESIGLTFEEAVPVGENAETKISSYYENLNEVKDKAQQKGVTNFAFSSDSFDNQQA